MCSLAGRSREHTAWRLGRFTLLLRPGAAASVLTILTALLLLPAALRAGELDPPRFAIEGVPFVSWSEAARLDYPDKDVLNPSMAAAWAMVGRYWEYESVSELMEGGDHSWGTIRTNQNGSLGDLKTALRTSGPLVVMPALTPWAHPMPSSALLMMQTDSVKMPRQLRSPPTSGLLGVLASFKTIKRLRWLPVSPFREAFRIAARVMVGYDDQKGVILLHDPSFGPSLEVTYSDFERMWRPGGAWYATVQPGEPDAVPTQSAVSHPAPSPEQRALRHWVYGYALASIGKINEAAEEYRRGLEIPDVSGGSRHVLLLELAICHREKGDNAAAIEAARQAADVIPEHHLAWTLLGQLHAESSIEGRDELAREHSSRAAQLEADPQALEIVAETLPQDILLPWTASALE